MPLSVWLAPSLPVDRYDTNFVVLQMSMNVLLVIGEVFDQKIQIEVVYLQKGV